MMIKLYSLYKFLYLTVIIEYGNGEHTNVFQNENHNHITGKDIPLGENYIKVHKCCEKYEILIGWSCVLINETTETQWVPTIITDHKADKIPVKYNIITGKPDCGTKQIWPIYHNASDKLQLLPNGYLRHYYSHTISSENTDDMYVDDEIDENFIDFAPGKYCMEKRIDDRVVSEFAWVCTPTLEKRWTNPEFLMRNIVNPITHFINISCLMFIAIVYFVMPTLRDLVGNIVTTGCLCLLVSQVGDMLRLLTAFSNHISLLIAEFTSYIFLIGTFFWLNSLGYYVWKTFKSRNVYLRITDKRKYCYYSMYSWTCTIVLGTLAVFSHFAMDYQEIENMLKKHLQYREQIGSLGLTILFTSIFSTIVLDVYFYISTMKTIGKTHTYGSIHHKLRHCFRMFILLFIILTVTWFFYLSSFGQFEALVNCYILVNALQGPIVLYVCVFNQKHVSFLIVKTCCPKRKCPCCEPDAECHWGDEMTAMNATSF